MSNDIDVLDIIDVGVIDVADDIDDLTLPGVDAKGQLLSSKPKDLHLMNNCPRCAKPLVPAVAVDGNNSSSFKECPQCGTLINTFNPTYYQARFLSRPERYKMTAGGFGSGKSRVEIEDVIKHLLLISRSVVAVVARTFKALDIAFTNEFKAIFPQKLIKTKNETKGEITLTNGSSIILRSFDDVTKLKSMNASMVVIVEASDTPYNGFQMLQTRLRLTSAILYELDDNGFPVTVWDDKSQSYKKVIRVDVRHMNLDTNPSSNWVRSEFLLDSATVEYYGEAKDENYRFNKDPDPNKYTQIVSTSANPNLPDTYEEEATRGRSPAEIMQMFKGSFNFSSRLIFPNVGLCIVPPKPLPPMYDEHGKRALYFLIGADYGIGDPTHIVYMALSTITGKIYVIAEMRVDHTDVPGIAKEHRNTIRQNSIDVKALLKLPDFDGWSWNKTGHDLKILGEHFKSEGLFFNPAFYKHDIRIVKLNSYINTNQIEIYSTNIYLIEELLNYRYKVDKNGITTKVPEDGKDHGITALALPLVDLPSNLMQLNLRAYLPEGTHHIHDKHYDKAERVKRSVVYNPFEEGHNGAKNNNYFNNITVTGSGNSSYLFLSDPEEDDDNEQGIIGAAYIPKDYIG